MIFMEQELTEAEALMFVQEAIHDPKNQKLREELIDPIIAVLEKPSGRKQYIDYGSSFLGENATMLSREYPTKAVTFPRKYVDGLFGMFDFTMKSFKVVLKDVLKSVSSSTEFATITASPTNVIHSVALFYSDMIGNRLLRDSARQQLGLSVYAVIFNKYFPSGLNESVMTYTFIKSLEWDTNYIKQTPLRAPCLMRLMMRFRKSCPTSSLMVQWKN